MDALPAHSQVPKPITGAFQKPNGKSHESRIANNVGSKPGAVSRRVSSQGQQNVPAQNMFMIRETLTLGQEKAIAIVSSADSITMWHLRQAISSGSSFRDPFFANQLSSSIVESTMWEWIRAAMTIIYYNCYYNLYDYNIFDYNIYIYLCVCFSSIVFILAQLALT